MPSGILFLCVPIGFWRDAYMGFEEPVEEGYVVKAEAESNLFDLQIGNLELTLGIGDNGFYNNLACGTFSYGLDS